MKKIIVIAYKFPPYDGIAARRWAKFCKYIAKENYTVHVITTNWKENKNSWNKDLNQSNIKIHIVNTPFLTILNAFPAFSKLLTRINFFLRYKILNKVDEADFWTKAAKKEINRLIKKEKINTVIATGAPFSVNVLASRLKNENNDLKIIQDLRDPWTDSEVVKTMQDKIKYRQFIELEKEILSNSDIIVAVTEPLVEMFRKKSPGSNALFTCITNGFDPEDKADIENKSQFNLDEKEINISYFGMLGVGRSEQIKKISEALENMPKMRLKINIFGDDKSPICTQIKNGPTKDYFNFFPYLPNEDVQYFMHISDVHLSLNADFFHYLHGTKIFDALLHNKYSLLVSPPGDLSNLILKNHLGYHAQPDIGSIKIALQQIESDFAKAKPELTFNPLIDSFSIKELTKKYLQLIGN